MNGCIEVVGKNWTRDGGFLIVNDVQFFPTTSMTAWSYMQHTAMSGAEHDALRQALLEYCELDTLAMVFIWKHFLELTAPDLPLLLLKLWPKHLEIPPALETLRPNEC